MTASKFGIMASLAFAIMAAPDGASADEPTRESSYRVSIGGGVSDFGSAGRVGLESENWIRPGLAIGGRLAFGRDMGGGLQRSVSTVAFGLRSRGMESESGYLSFGISGGFTHLGTTQGESSEGGNNALERPKDDNPAFSNSLGECIQAAGSCGGFGLSPNFRGNLGLDAGWVMTRPEKKDTHFFLRAQSHGLPLSGASAPMAYTLSFNIGFGESFTTPASQPMPNVMRGL